MLVDLYEALKVTTAEGQLTQHATIVSFRPIREVRHRRPDGKLVRLFPAAWPSRQITVPDGSSLVDLAGSTKLRVGRTANTITASAALGLATKGRADFAVLETWAPPARQAALPLSFADPTLPPVRRYT